MAIKGIQLDFILLKSYATLLVFESTYLYKSNKAFHKIKVTVQSQARIQHTFYSNLLDSERLQIKKELVDMIKKIRRTLIILGCSIILCVGCESKAGSKGQNTNDTGSEGSIIKNIQEESGIDTSRKALDWSEKLSDLSIVDEQEITEARIYGYDENVYNTTDSEIIGELVKRISELKLEVIEPDEESLLVEGYEELFLLNNNKVVYHLLYTDYLHVGSNTYGPKDKLLDFHVNVMDYCRETFWKQPNAYYDEPTYE